jgi:hypothetical protein
MILDVVVITAWQTLVLRSQPHRLALRSRHGVAPIYLDEIYVSYSCEQFGND